LAALPSPLPPAPLSLLYSSSSSSTLRHISSDPAMRTPLREEPSSGWSGLTDGGRPPPPSCLGDVVTVSTVIP